MEDKKMNETESLELITQMIQNTRRNLDVGSGNMFLLWGYVSALVTLVITAGLYWTKNPAWMWGFWGIPALGYPLMFLWFRKQQKPVQMYGDKVLYEMWLILGFFCMVIVLGAMFTGVYPIILPLAAILISLGSMITGIIIRYTAFSGFSSVGMALGLDMLFDVLKHSFSLLGLWEFALVIIFVMVIPGHILNYKARKALGK